MTYKENITAILECYFNGFKEEIIDSACNSILKLEPCEDAISRQSVMSITRDFISDPKYTEKKLVDNLNKLPHVNPQPKSGHWFIDERPESDRETICSNCEQPIFKYHKLDFDYRPKYCPNCGVKMTESKE